MWGRSSASAFEMEAKANGYNPFFSPAFSKSPFVPNPAQSENGAVDIQIPPIPAKYNHILPNSGNQSAKGQPYDQQSFPKGSKGYHVPANNDNQSAKAQSFDGYAKEHAAMQKQSSKSHGSKSHVHEERFCCPLCKETFSNHRQLEQHTKMSHFVKNRHHCEICSKSFGRKDVLARHVNAKHTQSKVFECTKCGEIFYFRHHLTYHFAKKHDEGTAYCCIACEKTFPTKQSFQYHMESMKHSTEKQYQCPIPSCMKKFVRNDVLNRHIQDKHTSPC